MDPKFARQIQFQEIVVNGVRVRVADISEGIKRWRENRKPLEFKKEVVNGVEVFVCDIAEGMRAWREM